MSTVYAAGVKTNRQIQVLNAIDAASTPGKFQIGTAGMAVILIQKTLQQPCGSVSGSSLTFFGFPANIDALATGDMVEARFLDGDDNVIVSGLSVDVIDADIIVQNISVNEGQTTTVNELILTHG